MVNLRCPVCAGALEKRAGAYLCPKNHSFDIAKSGYVNLLLNSSQGHHGDDKLMVRARRDFLDKGYYDRFIAAVADAAAEFTPPEATVLDAGCGEGIYSLAVLRAIEKAGKHGELLGVDISKTALQYASKRSPDFTLCVASCAHLPVEDGSVDEVLNIFSPFVPEEFARVLKRSGYLLRAYPLREHLWELKALIYDTPRDNPPTPLETEGFTLVETREVRDIIHLSCNEDILSLFRMTPYYYKTAPCSPTPCSRVCVWATCPNAWLHGRRRLSTAPATGTCPRTRTAACSWTASALWQVWAARITVTALWPTTSASRWSATTPRV